MNYQQIILQGYHTCLSYFITLIILNFWLLLFYLFNCIYFCSFSILLLTVWSFCLHHHIWEILFFTFYLNFLTFIFVFCLFWICHLISDKFHHRYVNLTVIPFFIIFSEIIRNYQLYFFWSFRFGISLKTISLMRTDLIFY